MKIEIKIANRYAILNTLSPKPGEWFISNDSFGAVVVVLILEAYRVAVFESNGTFNTTTTIGELVQLVQKYRRCDATLELS